MNTEHRQARAREERNRIKDSLSLDVISGTTSSYQAQIQVWEDIAASSYYLYTLEASSLDLKQTLRTDLDFFKPSWETVYAVGANAFYGKNIATWKRFAAIHGHLRETARTLDTNKTRQDKTRQDKTRQKNFLLTVMI